MRLYILFAVSLLCLGVSSSASVLDIPSAEANVTVMIAGGGPPPAAGGTCPDGTYEFGLDFDHGDGVDYACDSEGTSYQKDASGGSYEISTDYGQSGYGFRATALDEYVQWDSEDTNVSIDVGDSGTIWIGFYAESQGAEDPYILEFNQDSDNNVRIRISNSDTPMAVWNGNADFDYVQWSGTSLSATTWYRIGITWDQGAGSDDLCVVVDDGTWECDTDSISAWSASNNIQLVIGEEDAGNSERDFRVDDVFYLDGYQQGDPHGTY